MVLGEPHSFDLPEYEANIIIITSAVTCSLHDIGEKLFVQRKIIISQSLMIMVHMI
jgi:hypothetical protein